MSEFGLCSCLFVASREDPGRQASPYAGSWSAAQRDMGVPAPRPWPQVPWPRLTSTVGSVTLLGEMPCVSVTSALWPESPVTPPFSCPPPPCRHPVLLALPPSTGEPHPSPPPAALPPALPPQAQPLWPEHQPPPPSWPCRLHSAPKDRSNSAACESELSLTPCNPMDCSPPGSSVHGIL